MPTDLDLNKFYTQAVTRGFSRDYQLRVTDIKINGETFLYDNLVFVKNATVPGIKTSTSQVVYNGVTFYFPALQDFKDKNNYSVTFLADKALKDRSWFMERLKERAPNNFSGTPRALLSVPNVADSGNNYITLSVIDDNLNEINKFKLVGVYVQDISDVKYTMEGTGKVQEFTVVFGYIDVLETSYVELITVENSLKTEPGDVPELNPLSLQANGRPIQGGSADGGFISTLSSIAKGAAAVTGAVRGVTAAVGATRTLGRTIRGR
jgi:hypothetical protein